jgi:hypothetical protein
MLNTLTHEPEYLRVITEYVTQVGLSERGALSPGRLPRESTVPWHPAILVNQKSHGNLRFITDIRFHHLKRSRKLQEVEVPDEAEGRA